MTAVPALAQDTNPAAFLGAAPLAIAVGAGAFAILALALMRTMRSNSQLEQRRAGDQISGLRALVDEYEALLSGPREVTVLWTESTEGGHRLLGQAASVLPIGRRPESVLNFASWLNANDAEKLARHLEDLRVHGHGFADSVTTLDGRLIRANGWVIGGGAALRLRPAFLQPGAEPTLVAAAATGDLSSVRTVLSALSQPAFARDKSDRLVYANAAYLQLAKAAGKNGTEAAPPELLDTNQLRQHLAACNGDQGGTMPVAWPGLGAFEVVEFTINGGRAGYLRPAAAEDGSQQVAAGLGHVGGIIAALTTPIAIFNAKRELVQFNEAYAALWGLSRVFLVPGLDERAILDKLRTESMLPNVVDYQTWRSKHLESYNRKTPHEDEPWHLPDGRTIKVISAPAGPQGGVIYVFEDLTERLQLESTNKSFSNVQRETINALSEAVAVFGTNGRLTLSNPRLSALWKLPTNELGKNPHIDQIAEASGRAIPEDGASIWRDLKRGIIDLNPTRSDQTGRLNRSDGRLLDYAITRLPDGQTMMTFLDVTESASYSKVLKERNDALVAADLLKDAFVENVSYELRSPLTNIIGFADLLANEGGVLSERQQAYIDYIRASSVTLGVLIDNILDLASVDAGIAELRPEHLDVVQLIDKAKAGLSATFPEISGEKPINLVVDIERGLPPFIADGTRIVQVLYNLLSNAARFSPPGGEIRLSVAHRADRMLFVIEDEGPGVTDEMRAAIQTRIDTPSGRQRGAGLGLAIVKTFVNLHGGTIIAEKREPRGSRIVVNLPLDSAMAGVAE
ncbi:MAG: PAS-domain containing protein [Candidatus Devosia phytovorans]|uniref:histidine kinase n=1 Tax=Candidatus Devosia phytovorans TaxID=3121372 RepID=A0AAJ5VTT6_9HYPH|nr:PAS domain-containing sensor histidine kinase [Devosia sp.]WEK03810.1 MAG: PAS-domain containing protein [Devosia sp.]